MLKSLSVENYALIDKTEVLWNGGFSVITGETGSGKSILLGALGLIQGSRADVKVLKDPDKKCVVEAEFDVSNYDLKSFFEENEFEYDESCLIRREIAPNGKSRAFVNDTPASLSVLKDLTSFLIDIHSQHATLLLSQDNFQMHVLDVVAGTKPLLESYEGIYKQYVAEQKKLSDLKKLVEEQNANKDYLEFQLKQLQEANFAENEQVELEVEVEQLSHTSELKEVLEQAQWHLSDKEESICGILKEIQDKMSGLSSVYKDLGGWSERMNGAMIELKEIAREVETRLADVSVDPQRIEFVNARLDLIYTLEKKHKVDNLHALLVVKKQFEEEFQKLGSSEEMIAEIEQNIAKLKGELTEVANVVTECREQASGEFGAAVSDILHNLGMGNAKFEVRIEPLENFTAKGKDKVTFVFAANKNGVLQPIASVASGGELSRVMLALKSILSKKENLPTIILDEIDTGVSGEVADRMGELMKSMGEYMQVVSITHLPQIAAKCSTHYKVYKEDDADSTVSHIVQLSLEQRVEEIAHMLSGANLTEAALENARVLMGVKL